MKPILSLFIEKTGVLNLQNGFYRNKNTFARIINDVLQTYTFEEHSNNCECNIRYGIFPLCMNLPRIDIGTYTLHCSNIEVWKKGEGWHFNQFSEKDMCSCVDAITESLESDLLSFLNQTKCCESALRELVKLDEFLEKNRISVLAHQGLVDYAIPWKERSLMAPEKYYMSLKAHNFDYAYSYLQFMSEWYKSKLNHTINGGESIQSPVVIERWSRKYELVSEHMQMMERNNISFFDKLIHAQEKQTCDTLLSRYPKLQNKGLL